MWALRSEPADPGGAVRLLDAASIGPDWWEWLDREARSEVAYSYQVIVEVGGSQSVSPPVLL